MSFWPLAATSLGAVLAFTFVIWLISVRMRNVAIVDVIWSLCFVIIAGVALAAGAGDLERRGLLFALVAIWGVRLSVHLGIRNIGKPEDYRYAAWRVKYGVDRYWWFSLFQVFWLQGLLAWMVAAPILVVGAAPVSGGFDPLWLGVVLWAIGFYFEAVGDWQLARFKRDPANKGKVMDRGLWRYTRHPNYFGDFAVWWGFGLIALAAPWGWLALLGPALMSFLLLRVSGVAMLERTIGSRREGYAEYAARTSAFFPRPRRRAA